METVCVKDKQFSISIPESTILDKVAQVGKQISQDLQGKDVLFVCVLNGAFMFASDLLKQVTIPCDINFLRLASYAGMSSTGNVKEIFGLTGNLEGRTIVIIEDIIDSGLTMKHLLELLKERGASDVRIASLLVKYDNLQTPLDIAYTCFSIPNDFIVGYGLDYDGYGRNLRSIYTVLP